MKISKILMRTASVALLTTCMSCVTDDFTKPKHNSDVGSVMITPQPPIPWFRIKAALLPTFTASANDMLARVAPDTLTEQRTSVTSTNLGLSVTGPTTLSTQTSGNNLSNSLTSAAQNQFGATQATTGTAVASNSAT